VEDFFQILWPSQNIGTLTTTKYHRTYLITTHFNTNIVCIVNFFRCEMVCPKISFKKGGYGQFRIDTEKLAKIPFLRLTK
jgi:hypothetical protein